MKRILPLICGLYALSGCAYMGTWAKQSYYSYQLKHSPRQRTSKHLLDHPTFFVFGKIASDRIPPTAPTMILAISTAPTRDEIVDISRSVRGDSYYGLNLPPGDYQLIGAADLDGDGFCSETEVVAKRSLRLESSVQEKIVGNYDLTVVPRNDVTTHTFRVAVQRTAAMPQSAFYPKGTLRQLDDPIFSPQMASLGMYEPAAFMEVAPMMFYSLEEELGYKVPVIFVHGIGGSARDFENIVSHLDRRRYRAWFFHYPSGGDLHQLGAMFYEIFLSGNTIPQSDAPVVIVAHSMGGLVVREAMNRWHATAREARIGSLITIASPLGGHPAAARGTHAPVVIPSWRDLDPHSNFIEKLYRTPIPSSVAYHLFYTFGDPRALKFGEPGDGTVPLASQLSPAAQREASEQFGFNCSHTGVLCDPRAIERIVKTIEEIKSPYPEDHLREFDRSGYAVDLPEKDFSPLDTYFVRFIGHYLDALVDGTIQPANSFQTQFVRECRESGRPETPAAKAWLKFNRLYPKRAELPSSRGTAVDARATTGG